MDATKMDFESGVFDLTIDKGTLDAISCAKEDNESYKLVKEMHRVTKVKGYYCFVTHSPADSRISIFEDNLESDSYQIECLEVELSFVSNLINALRANKDKSLSMKEALKDKSFLMKTILEVLSASKNKDEKIDITSIISDLKTLKFIKSDEPKTNQDHQNEKTLEPQKSSEVTSIEETPNKEKEIPQENKENKISIGNDTNENDEFDNPQEKSNNIRRSNCYLYIVKKLK